MFKIQHYDFFLLLSHLSTSLFFSTEVAVALSFILCKRQKKTIAKFVDAVDF